MIIPEFISGTEFLERIRAETMIEIVETIEGFQLLADEWDRVACRQKNPLLQHDWFSACSEAFCPPDKLRILVSRHDGRVNAIAPLAWVRRGPTGRLELLGTRFVDEFGGFIYDGEEGLRDLLRYIMDMQQPTRLGRLCQDSAEVALLSERRRDHLTLQADRVPGSPWVQIDRPWPEYEQSLSSRDRYTFRRAQKRARELGKVDIDIFCPSLDELDAHLEEIFRVEASGWKEENRTTMKSDPWMNKFYRAYARRAACKNTLRLAYLKIDNRLVAFQLAVEYANRYWVLKIGYDESFARCSPGVLLMHEAIRAAFDKKLETVEFLGHDDTWLHMWTEAVHQCTVFRLYPFSMKGIVTLVGESSAVLGRRLRHVQLRLPTIRTSQSQEGHKS